MANTTIAALPPAGAITGAELLVLSQSGVMSSVTAALLAAYVVPLAADLVGFIKDFAGSSVPAGYLLCPTALTNISRTTYAALFAVIGTTWGVGDGSTTFGLPWFPADYAAVQASGNVGTQTVGQNLSHVHTWSNGATTIQTTGVAGANWGSTALGESNASMVASGGASNLAAGSRVLKVIKF